MILVGKGILHEFKTEHPDAQSDLNSWEAEVEGNSWGTPHVLKEQYPRASILRSSNVIFDICGNRYRLWVQVIYQSGIMIVKKIGTHEEYDKWPTQ